VPFHEPGSAVSVCPVFGVPAIVGMVEFVGAWGEGGGGGGGAGIGCQSGEPPTGVLIETRLLPSAFIVQIPSLPLKTNFVPSGDQIGLAPAPSEVLPLPSGFITTTWAVMSGSVSENASFAPSGDQLGLLLKLSLDVSSTSLLRSALATWTFPGW